MKEVITTPGKYQVVRSENGCTVTQTMDNGQRIEDNVPAGESTAVFAFTSRIEVDDDSAVVREVFKLAPYQKLRLLGVVGGDVPAWFKALREELTAMLDGSKFELAWLAGEKKLVVHTDRISDELSDAVTALLERVLPQNVEVVHTNYLLTLPSDYTAVDYLEGNGNPYMIIPVNDEPEDDLEVVTYGAFVDTPKGVEGKTGGADNTSFFWGISGNLYAGCGSSHVSNLKPDTDWHTFVLRKSTVQNGEFIVDGNRLISFSSASVSFLQGYGYGLWRLSNASWYTTQASKKSYVIIRKNDKVLYHLVSALDPTGAPCMFDLVSRTPFYVAKWTGDFTYPGKEIEATTYSLRNRIYAQLTEHGIRRLYKVPDGCNMSKKEYAEANGFKIIVETPMPEEGYWVPELHEREDCIELEWVEAEPPADDYGLPDETLTNN